MPDIQNRKQFNGNGGHTIAPSDYIRLLPPDLQRSYAAGKVIFDDFCYVAEFLPLAASGTSQQDVQITADSHFIILYTAAIVTAVDNTTFVAIGSVPILSTWIDTGSGRQLSSAAVAFSNYFGSIQQPHVLGQPKLMRAGSTLSVKVQNLEAVARQVRCAFHGAKVFVEG